MNNQGKPKGEKKPAPEPIEPAGAKGKNYPLKSPPPSFEFDPARTRTPSDGGPPGS
ncbi:MAG: hypothetical protein U0547_02370 [Dehalococcoidia bacterium]